MKKLWQKFITKQFRKFYPDRLETVSKRMVGMDFSSRSKLYYYLEQQPVLSKFFTHAKSRIKRKENEEKKTEKVG